MEEVLIGLAKQSPGLAVAVTIVVIFVRQIKVISDRCHDTQAESSAVLREITKAITEVTERLRLMNGKGR